MRSTHVVGVVELGLLGVIPFAVYEWLGGCLSCRVVAELGLAARLAVLLLGCRGRVACPREWISCCARGSFDHKGTDPKVRYSPRLRAWNPGSSIVWL